MYSVAYSVGWHDQEGHVTSDIIATSLKLFSLVKAERSIAERIIHMGGAMDITETRIAWADFNFRPKIPAFTWYLGKARISSLQLYVK